jgi:glutamyl-Q tRNA(Asp) synthetase
MKKLLFPCACWRSELSRAASAPDRSDASETAVYPGTCRAGLPPGRPARAIRFRVPAGVFTFEDVVFGSLSEDVAASVGDFVVKRADGPFAYQLAVVADDAKQGVTEVVRGADLLSSTARQIALQRALGFPTPAYAHLPLVLSPDGTKLGKRDGALPLAQQNTARVRKTLGLALRILGQDAADGSPREMLEEALRRFDPRAIPRGPFRIAGS